MSVDLTNGILGLELCFNKTIKPSHNDIEDALKLTITRLGDLEMASYLLAKRNFISQDKISFPYLYQMFIPVSSAIPLHLFVKNNLELIEGFDSTENIKNELNPRIKTYLQKGNFEEAAKLAKIHFELDLDPLNELVESLITGLKNSYENNNKYQAILHLVNKAGIEIPTKYQYLLESRSDHHKTEEFSFLDGLFHKLASHYLNLVKYEFRKTLKNEQCDVNNIEDIIEAAFKNFNFNEIKSLCPNSKKLSKINDKFTGYYEVFGNALNMIDNDLALEILTINGLKEDLIQDEVTVFRGIKMYEITYDDIDSYFKYGHRSFSTLTYRFGRYIIGDQRSLGFNIDSLWNKPEERGLYKYGATYNSMDLKTADVFAGYGPKNFIFEIKLTKNLLPKFCNNEGVGGFGKTDEYEILTSTIYGENIVAIRSNDHEGKAVIYRNPYINEEITPLLKINKNGKSYIENNENQLELYDNVVCKDFIARRTDSRYKFKSYEEFLDKYSVQDHIKDQDNLYNEYFLHRPVYNEPFVYGLVEEVDLDFQCSLA